MIEIIDLSQEIYDGMPVYKSLPQVKVKVARTHEEWNGEVDPLTTTPSVLNLNMSEHTGTHVDSISHMGKEFKETSIDKMPLSMFYTKGFCVDFSHKKLKELITSEELKEACIKADCTLLKGDTLLIYTDHYRQYFNTDDWGNGPGLTAEATRWLGAHKIAAFGVEMMSPGVPQVSNREVHRICGELGFTHYENMINLHKLIGRGRFRFVGLPLKIKGGTGSPVRAVAIFEDGE